VSHRRAGSVSVADAARRALAALGGAAPVALVTVVSARREDTVGRRLVVGADSVIGTLGSVDLDETAVVLARESLVDGSRGTHEIETEDGRIELYVESHRATPELVIVGAGHIARPLHRLGAMLGFRVTVIDDRAEFASEKWFPEAVRVLVVDFNETFKDVSIGPNSYIVLVTRGHKYDYDCIQQVLTLPSQPAYLGMIGSRRRVRAAFEALVRDGVEPERLATVHAPIGLDIGAETPEEIALAIAAEIVAVRRGGTGGELSGGERVLERVARGRSRKKGGETNG
jgi:xanthine dehydrogenase accessory factor